MVLKKSVVHNERAEIALQGKIVVWMNHVTSDKSLELKSWLDSLYITYVYVSFSEIVIFNTEKALPNIAPFNVQFHFA